MKVLWFFNGLFRDRNPHLKKPRYRIRWRKFVDVPNCDGSNILYRQYLDMPVFHDTICKPDFYLYKQ